jgi:hypothetical protein
MAVTTLMTIEELRKLPEDTGAVCHELRHGDLEHFAPPGRLVDTKFGLRPLPEHELRVADVVDGAKMAVDAIFA